MYENTGAQAHLMAADLIEAGVDVNGIYRRLYEGMPYAKLELLGRALAAIRRYEDGRLTMALLTRDDFRLAGAEDSHSEGIIDHLRSVEGTKVAALARELIDGSGDGRKKVSLRSHRRRGRRLRHRPQAGGGGHRQAAGFATTMAEDELVAFLRDGLRGQLAGLGRLGAAAAPRGGRAARRRRRRAGRRGRS